MSDLRFNTIAGTVLAAGLAALGLREVANAVYHPHYPEQPGYQVAVADVTTPAAGGEEVTPTIPDWGRLFADEAQLASLVVEGEKQHKVCTSCHQFEQGGANATGPALYGVFGRAAGSHPGFNYSEAMRGYGQTWTYDNLYAYLAAPRKYVPGTSMAFAGVRNSDDRVALVAYLRSLAASPAPLPAPLPETVAPAPDGAEQVPVTVVPGTGGETNAAPMGASNDTPAGGAPESPGTP